MEIWLLIIGAKHNKMYDFFLVIAALILTRVYGKCINSTLIGLFVRDNGNVVGRHLRAQER